ncbi:hypothetical protein [Pseudozobellia thermophila]|uniref:Membrane or secreted protein n=1 Tax=Pseudozobellia thermophila TaxID=192903 RepID=A0A1M6CH30_9FLAO|nr:hypothetical protein [Pseudozobellia thermophila]SHI60286.1 hypothetical protein SAMN04488513_101763 [Pseudozobellia thermophila]
MKRSKLSFGFTLLLIFCLSISSATECLAQIADGVYFSDQNGQRHELKVKGDYLTLTVYETSPAQFIKTEGGFYSIENGQLSTKLEFNSNYESDQVSEWSRAIVVDGSKLTLGSGPSLTFTKAEPTRQELDGTWLFATRGPDEGQERRDDTNPRKTLKFLIDGRFQWIAYNTDTYKFHGTGGGSYTSTDGKYTENIEFFSRDNTRVGATLEFDYEIKEDDWHHKGKNSKGEPMYEIWSRR